VEVARQRLWRQVYKRGAHRPAVQKNVKRRGTRVRFKPDPEIFGKEAAFQPGRVFRMARAKAYLFGGVEPLVATRPASRASRTPEKDTFHFETACATIWRPRSRARRWCTPITSPGSAKRRHGKVEWAVA
jgi:topoisomerase-4 subunit B